MSPSLRSQLWEGWSTEKKISVEILKVKPYVVWRFDNTATIPLDHYQGKGVLFHVPGITECDNDSKIMDDKLFLNFGAKF